MVAKASLNIMNLEQLANLGELLGGIAVIASLIYLAIQIRQNTKTVKSSTLSVNSQIWTTMLLTLGDKDNVAAFTYGYFPMENMDPQKFTQFQLQCRALFVSMEQQHYQYTQGTLDADTYEGYARSISNTILPFPGFRVYWDMYREDFSPLFRNHLDDLIANVEPATGDTIMTEFQKRIRQ